MTVSLTIGIIKLDQPRQFLLQCLYLKKWAMLCLCVSSIDIATFYDFLMVGQCGAVCFHFINGISSKK